MKIYTKTGDDGTTSLVGGKRVKKCCLRLEAYGTVDELSSHIGLTCSLLHAMELGGSDNVCGAVETDLQWIQQKLFCMGGALATDTDCTQIPSSCHILESDVTRLESMIDAIQQELPQQRSFILPGGCPAASQAHVARTVCRRVERLVIGLGNDVRIPENVVYFLNRLSDYLFCLARRLNVLSDTPEILWQ